jgi:hypothetical protein
VRDGDVLLVKDCIEQLGIQFVDEFTKLKELYEKQPDKFRALYVTEPDGTLGHKSASGNRELASLIAAALAKPGPAAAPPAVSPNSERTESESPRQTISAANNLGGNRSLHHLFVVHDRQISSRAMVL